MKMNKSINYISSIILALALHACSGNMDDSEYFGFDELLATYQNVCPSVTDAIEYPEFWYDVLNPFVPHDETVRSTSTCGLLVTLLEYPLYIMRLASSDLFQPRVTMFNDELQANKVAVELFNRGDFYPVLVSKYLSVIKNKFEWGGRAADSPYFIQWLLASDMSMSAMSQKEKIQLLVMALERTKYALDMESQEPCLIMIAIMKSCKYAHFMEDIEPRLIETMMGYTMLEPDGELSRDCFNCLSSNHIKIIVKYAKQFFNEQK